MARNLVYNQSSVAINVNGVISTNMGDQFAYSNERPESATRTVGVTTGVINNKSDKGGILHLRYFGISTTNDQLEELWFNQVRNRAIQFDVVILTAEGETVGCNGCAIGTPPTVEGGGPEQVTRQWSLVYQEYEPDKDFFF